MDEREEPGARLAALADVRAGRPPHGEERFLHRVLGERRVLEDAVREAVRDLPVAVVELRQREIAVRCGDEREQRLVGERSECAGARGLAAGQHPQGCARLAHASLVPKRTSVVGCSEPPVRLERDGDDRARVEWLVEEDDLLVATLEQAGLDRAAGADHPGLVRLPAGGLVEVADDHYRLAVGRAHDRAVLAERQAARLLVGEDRSRAGAVRKRAALRVQGAGEGRRPEAEADRRRNGRRRGDRGQPQRPAGAEDDDALA